MSNEMSSWRSLASAASRSIKGYVAQRDVGRPGRPTGDGTGKASWGQWAGQKIRSTLGPGDDSGGTSGVERISLFPGWACRLHRNGVVESGQDPRPFDVELFVSGFASRSSGPGFGTRTGRAFLRLAKSYASLPKLTNAEYNDATLGPNGLSVDQSAGDFLDPVHLPPPPDEMNDEAELEELNEQIHQLELESVASMSTQESSSSSTPSQADSIFDRQSGIPYPPGTRARGDLRKFHANLEARLHPFWASSLGSRAVHIAVYASDPEEEDFYKSPPLGSSTSDEDYAYRRLPIASADLVTAADGSFQKRFSIPWDHMCVHPAALQIAFGDPNREFVLHVTADLMPPPSRPPTPNNQVPYAVRTQTQRQPRSKPPTAASKLTVPITYAPVRLLSDIDDTVKMSGVLSGARAAFYNVFVKDLNESVIPGMGDWYMAMWERGVRFHYVSNAPFELLPVVNEFLQLSNLPPGSIKLKSYAGRSLFNGLLSAPADRKRAGIMDVLESFRASKFILVGDSGEQDMELYAAIAKLRPDQVLGIFIRDAGNFDAVPPLDDPTGSSFAAALAPQRRPTQNSPPQSSNPSPLATPSGNGRTPGATHQPTRSVSGSDIPTPRGTYTARQPKRTNSEFQRPSYASSTSGYFGSSSVLDSPVSEEPQPTASPSRQDDDASSTSSRMSLGRASTTSSFRGAPPMTDAERRQYDLQMRVYRARAETPFCIPLRIFRHPSECIEAAQILDKLNLGRTQLS
ncbi:hypothetical protein PHLGIDRAFT_112197 [Phlebiopsis gigantea 11061_1 CR5-6]|uniref:Phosphatidate phosphatase APP1 catalytic domain-containing protein n=1 Tax=Phlebiopsis gigantea (strain 11061_1 CR5-6) TaxID=745531 RepID=A0A0C3PBI6_PHLG1|nr:hypothetical protein PHLGIDRAFT_112197 [Phlebiopsis gigantea 11061_1 CR5-6]